MILREIKNMYFPALQQIEYLESTGTQYIDTGIVPPETFYSASIIVDTQFTDLTQRQLFGSTNAFYFGVNNGSWEMHYENHKNYADTYRHVISKEIQKSTLQLIFNLDNAYTDSQPCNANLENNLYENTAYLFALNESNNALFMCKCRLYSAKIYIDNVLVRNFIPVRVGNVGYMYDKVTKQLFGNAGTGNFVLGQDVDLILQQIYQNRLIEGVDYDVYTYLKGTGCCYIDTLINPAWNDQLSATTEVSGRPTVYNPCIFTAHGTNTEVGMKLGGGWQKDNIPQFWVFNRVVGQNNWIEFMKFPAKAELYCSFKVVNNSIPTVSFKANGASQKIARIYGPNIITELPDTTYKIGDSLSGLDVLKLKNVKINSHNFIPCKLKRTIPRDLDAQCKERVAGECGMIDLISGKFYGNVADSGTFTVENENNE